MPGLEALYQSYNASGFDVLGAPCNQFGLQCPGTDVEIPNAFRYVRPGSDFIYTFPLTKVIKVNPDTPEVEEPLYQFLKAECAPTKTSIGDPGSLYFSPVTTRSITWNFEKFLIDKTGRLYKRYAPAVPTDTLTEDIEYLLSL